MRRPRWQSYLNLAAIFLLAGQVCNAAVVASDGKATSESLLQLTSANWTAEIQKGAWLVEFFSPYCRHCKKFLPTWQELVTNKESLRTSYPDAPFTLAQVNCYSQQDICVKEKVPHIPRLSIYRDGVQMTGEYQGNREYTDLSNFVDKEAAEYRKVKGVSDEPHPLSIIDSGATPEVAKPDIEAAAAAPAKGANADAAAPKEAAPKVAPAAAAAPPDAVPKDPAKPADVKDAPPSAPAPAPPAAAKPPTPPEAVPVIVPGPNPNGIVLRFGKDEAVKDEAALKSMLSKSGGSGSTFIKFFASWCPHCKAMASAYTQIGDVMRGRINVVEVDCEQNHAICQHYDIRGYPTLRMYNEGEATEYRGGRSFEAMRSWAINAGSASGVREITANELDGLMRSDEVLFLYLHSTQTPEKEIDAVTKASRVLLTTSVHVYRSTDDQLITKYRSRLVQGSASSSLAADSYSGLLVFKDHDAEQPTSAYYPSKQVSNSISAQSATKQVAAWLEKERYSTVAEVTGSTFTDIIHNKQDAPVVLAALSDIHHSGRTQSTGSGSQLRDTELQHVRSLALAWRQRDHQEHQDVTHDTIRRRQKILFAWIDADRWASAIGKYYKIKSETVPRLVLADGARLEYYNLPSKFVDPFTSKKQPWIDNKEVIDTLDLIWLGKGPKAKSSRSYLDRGVRRTGAAAMSAARHPFLAFFAGSTLIFIMIQGLKRQALNKGYATTRLPYSMTKGD